MRMFLIYFFIVISGSAFSVQAQTKNRFPQSKITATEWQQHFDEVKALPDAKVQEGKIQTQVSFASADKHEIYYFTNSNHPAHPAVIKISVYIDSVGETQAGVTGNYGGAKEDFDPWFKWALGLVVQQKSKQ